MDVLKGMRGRELRGIRHLFLDYVLCGGFQGLVLSGMFWLKGVCELGFEERKGCVYVIVYRINLVLLRIFKKSKGRKHKNPCKDGDVCRILPILMQAF